MVPFRLRVIARKLYIHVLSNDYTDLLSDSTYCNVEMFLFVFVNVIFPHLQQYSHCRTTCYVADEYVVMFLRYAERQGRKS